METESVKTNVFGHILEVTLNRPKANAIDLKTSQVMGDICLLYTSPSPRDGLLSRMPSSA